MGEIVVTNRDGVTETVDAQEGLSIMENIIDLDASVEAVCGGMCLCATCHCYVDPDFADKLPAREEEETWLLDKLDSFDSVRSRLSCQVQYTDDLDGMKLEVAPEE